MRNFSRACLGIAIVTLFSLQGVPTIEGKNETTTPAPDGLAGSPYLRVAVQDDIKGLNPFAVNDVWSSNVVYNVLDGTVNRDWKTEKYQPWVAVEWCTESNATPGGCSKDDGDENVLNVTIRYQVGAWRAKFGGPVLFHDGVEVTIDDILHSYAMTAYNGRWVSSVKDLMWKKSEGYDWNNPPFGDNSFQKITIGGVGGEEGWLAIRKADDHTLQFRLKQPFADFFQDTVSVVLMPKHIWGPHIDIVTGLGDYLQWELGYDAQTGTAPGMIGTGPFRFDKWIQGQFSRILKNDLMFDWTRLPLVDDRGRMVRPDLPCDGANHQACAYDPAWTRLHPLPYIDGLEFWIHLTVESGVLALQQAKVDFVAWSIPPGMVNDLINSDSCTDLDGKRVQCREVIGIEKTSERGFFYTAFNMRRQPTGYRDFPNGDLTDDGKPFRKAIAYSTDKATIVSQLLQGFGKVALGPVSPDLRLWHNDSLPSYPLDETKANAILDAAGWKRDPSCPKIGIPADHARRLPRVGCDPVEFLTPEAGYDPIRAVAGQMIEAAAQKVGLNVDAVAMSFGKIVTQITNRDFDMYMLGWRITGDPPGYLRSFFHCSEEKSGNNYPGYCNPVADALIDELDRTTNQSRRIQIVKDLQGILAEDLPYLVMYFRDSVEAFRKDRFIVPLIDPPSWIKGTAGVNNAWNWMLVQPAGRPATLTAKFPSVIACERSYLVTVGLLSGTRPLEGAAVSAQATAPLRFAGGATTATAVTDGSGQATFQLLAARIPGQANAWVNLSSSKDGYYPVYRDLAIQVICDGPMPPVGELVVAPMQVAPGGTARVSVRVMSLADDTPIEGARVKLEPPSLGSLDASELVTDSDGAATTTFRLGDTVTVGSAISVTLTGVPSATIGGEELTGPAFGTEFWAVPLASPCVGCEGQPDPTPLVGAVVALAVGSVATLFAARWLLKRKR